MRRDDPGRRRAVEIASVGPKPVEQLPGYVVGTLGAYWTITALAALVTR